MLPLLIGIFVGTTAVLTGHWAETGPQGLVEALTLSLKISPPAHRALPSQFIWGSRCARLSQRQCSQPDNVGY